MPFKIIRNDLVDVKADALVLPSNSNLVINGGTGLAVGKRAGLWRLRRACKRIGSCEVGAAVSTPAFNLPAKRLIHAVGPRWSGSADDEQLLRSAYDASLALAAELGCESVALPLLSAGTFGCPPHISLHIALDAIEAHLVDHETLVTLVLYSRKAVKAGLAEFAQIESYIDDNYVSEHRMEEFSAFGNVGYARAAPPPPPPGTAAPRSEVRDASFAELSSSWEDDLFADRDDASEPRTLDSYAQSTLAQGYAPASAPMAAPVSTTAPSPMAAPKAAGSLEDMLGSLDAGFSETLLALIDESGRTDADVYKRANLTRQHFSKIRKDPNYRPTKRTALSLAVALELDLPATQDLLARAGYTLTHASKFDVIVEYFIVNGDYNTFKINEALYAYDQQLLGT